MAEIARNGNRAVTNAPVVPSKGKALPTLQFEFEAHGRETGL
jgi:hypothetical protein